MSWRRSRRTWSWHGLPWPSVESPAAPHSAIAPMKVSLSLPPMVIVTSWVRRPRASSCGATPGVLAAEEVLGLRRAAGHVGEAARRSSRRSRAGSCRSTARTAGWSGRAAARPTPRCRSRRARRSAADRWTACDGAEAATAAADGGAGEQEHEGTTVHGGPSGHDGRWSELGRSTRAPRLDRGDRWRLGPCPGSPTPARSGPRRTAAACPARHRAADVRALRPPQGGVTGRAGPPAVDDQPGAAPRSTRSMTRSRWVSIRRRRASSQTAVRSG